MSLPIRLHTAVKEHSAGFSMISPCCNGFVGYDTKCKTCGKPVSRADTKKGYKVGDTVVVINPAELEQLLPKSTKTINIDGFTTAEEVSWIFANKPYFTSPNLDPKKGGNPTANKVYQLIRQQLELKGMVAFGSYVVRGKQHPIILRPYQGRLVLQQLWWFDEVRNPPEVEPCEITDRERELAGKLVEKLTEKFDISKFVDTYQQRVSELITARAMGNELAPIEKPPTPTDDFEKALEASVEAVA